MKYKQITTLAAVFAALNLNPDTKPDVSAWPERYHAHKTHEFNVQMAIDAVNEGWVADWNNTDQKKHFLWLWIIEKKERVSGRGLSLYGVYYVYTYTYVGPRLVFESEAKARHFYENFLALYEDYYLG
jgi:hypothetical protein